MTLDLNALTVQSFDTVEGDPSQWLMGPPPTEGCDTNLYAPTPPYASCGCVDP